MSSQPDLSVRPEATDTTALVAGLARAARAAQRQLARMDAPAKERALLLAAQALRDAQADILAANAQDMANGAANGLSAAMLDRLKLTPERLASVADAVAQVAVLADPVGQVIDTSTRPNGMVLERLRIPVGVIGIVYESRPNVTADAAALCVRSGNAAILRGGSEAVHSNRAIHTALVAGLVAGGVPAAAVQLLPTQDRAAVGAMLAAAGLIDMIVPRGGKSLVARVQADARVPVLAHLDGINHTYVHAAADPAMARAIALNAKMRRTGICGATETLLVDRAAAATHLVPILAALSEAGCEIRGDDEVVAAFPGAGPATEEDWSTEYLDAIISVRLVDGVGGAIEHIGRYSSSHTEAIVAEDAAAVERFFREVDSAILLHNASTQFADGGEFGMGAEIGIATGRMHARGPVGVEQLTSFKYRVHGTGQTRP